MARLALLACLIVPLMLIAGRVAAADPEVEALREQLRSTVLQLRQLQDQQATNAAPPAVAVGPDAEGLKAKLAAAEAALRATRRSVAAMPGLKASLAKAQADNTALTAAAAANGAELEKYKAAFAQADAAQRGLAGERDHLKAQLVQASAILAACQAKNVRLTAFAEDLLAAYGKVGFRQVLAAREPILGLKRVQLENIAQEREDTVRADHCDPRLDAAGPAKPPSPPPAG
jgi:chromosome segregation ATPase